MADDLSEQKKSSPKTESANLLWFSIVLEEYVSLIPDMKWKHCCGYFWKKLQNVFKTKKNEFSSSVTNFLMIWGHT
jgi:hypothetical protein